MKIKEILKKLKLKIKKMIEEERKQYTYDCFDNRVKRDFKRRRIKAIIKEN